MNLLELKKIVDSIVETQKEPEKINVVVATQDFSIGYSPAIGVKGAYMGFDWDMGRFMIYPSVDLIKKEK